MYLLNDDPGDSFIYIYNTHIIYDCIAYISRSNHRHTSPYTYEICKCKKIPSFEAFEMRHDVVFANALSPAVGERRDGIFLCSAHVASKERRKKRDGTGASFLHNILFHFILASFFRTYIYERKKHKILAIISKPFMQIHYVCALSAGIQTAAHTHTSCRCFCRSCCYVFSCSVENVSITKCHSMSWIHFSGIAKILEQARSVL